MISGYLNYQRNVVVIKSDVPGVLSETVDLRLIHDRPDVFYGYMEIAFRGVQVMEKLEEMLSMARRAVALELFRN